MSYNWYKQSKIEQNPASAFKWLEFPDQFLSLSWSPCTALPLPLPLWQIRKHCHSDLKISINAANYWGCAFSSISWITWYGNLQFMAISAIYGKCWCCLSQFIPTVILTINLMPNAIMPWWLPANSGCSVYVRCKICLFPYGMLFMQLFRGDLHHHGNSDCWKSFVIVWLSQKKTEFDRLAKTLQLHSCT